MPYSAVRVRHVNLIRDLKNGNVSTSYLPRSLVFFFSNRPRELGCYSALAWRAQGCGFDPWPRTTAVLGKYTLFTRAVFPRGTLKNPQVSIIMRSPPSAAPLRRLSRFKTLSANNQLVFYFLLHKGCDPPPWEKRSKQNRSASTSYRSEDQKADDITPKGTRHLKCYLARYIGMRTYK